MIHEAVTAGYLDAGEFKVPDDSVQPASLDLRLGDRAYRLRCSFLPDNETVDEKMKPLVIDELDLRDDGAILEPNRPYLIPLLERLALPDHLRGRANPKSSTGRLDVFTRVITDHSYRFDEIAPGYEGPLYLEVVPLSFAVRVRQGLALNQLRLVIGRSGLSDDELRDEHARNPLLFRDGAPLPDAAFATADGLFLSLDLRGDDQRRVGYRAKPNSPRIVAADIGTHRVEEYWEPVLREEGDRIVLDPERFYLLLSDEGVQVPPHLAAEMTAFDPTSGELRTHYAGFFDPGFGYARDSSLAGSRAALEVRGPRRAVHDRARPTGLQAHLRAHARRARTPLRGRGRLQLPGPGRHVEQALRQGSLASSGAAGPASCRPWTSVKRSTRPAPCVG